MRYIRFLKTPRVVDGKNSPKASVHSLITITSDLGDSFLPNDLLLSVELISAVTEEVIVWTRVKWTGGMRTLPITLPLSRSRALCPLRVRVGVEPKAKFDEYGTLSSEDSKGVVSAWSGPLDPTRGAEEAVKLVERRFRVADRHTVHMWEETGESIARHIWDAGVAVTYHLEHVLSMFDTKDFTVYAEEQRNLRVLELGTGCGIVGICIAQSLENSDVILTDLPEAKDIVKRNIKESALAQGTTLSFLELDWEHESLDELNTLAPLDLVITADCTYNPDSSPALVNTMARITRTSPNVAVAVAMKVRHSSEDIFFQLMAEAGFQTTNSMTFPLPGDEKSCEETVDVYFYRRGA
ncbi:putative methyltransferase-domain-containing protein [Massariosphaeria phaeospora]|uniref:Putative methyltransferase-domain-containing protein n=1 Tax=Massariosphaeria phaeospora TaxID=100035 RepID=A0A7C8MGC1_9PLEO|nr:putative methyltransferase-domain-containing protein [Massariosphaeria phaeospora]